MSEQFLVHLPDGTEYGPIDRAALSAWRDEGRLPADSLVWPYGAPEWLSVEDALALAPVTPSTDDVTHTLVRGHEAPAPAGVKAASAPAAAALTPHASRPAPAMARPRPAAKPVGAATPAAPAPRTVAATPGPAAAPASAARSVSAAARPTAQAKTPSSQAAPAAHAARAPSPSPTPAVPPGREVHAPSQRALAVGAGEPGEPSPDTRPPRAAPAFARRAQPAPGIEWRKLKPFLLAAVGLGVVVGVLLGLWVLLRPYVARRWAMASVQREATADRRLEDRELGLVAELPAGWLALRPENPFVTSKGAHLRLAQPAIGAFATVTSALRPRLMDAPDAYLDELLLERLPRQPSVAQQGREDVQLGRGQGRLLRTTWQDGFSPMLGATVVWADGYRLFAAEAWAPADAGSRFQAELAALVRGIRTSGLIEARVSEAVERVALEVPELPRDALRLLVADHLSRGPGLEGVPRDALRLVSRGLDALDPTEAAEMRVIYQLIWEPVPEAERQHLASLLASIKAGREVPGEDVQPLRDALKAGVLALPAQHQGRLQELSGRALRKALAGS